MVPKLIAVLVDYEGNVQHDVRHPPVRLLHEANFIALKDDDGTFTVWKDREADHGSKLSLDQVNARVRHFVRWAQLRNMMPRV